MQEKLKKSIIIQPYRPRLGHHRKKLFREPQPKWGNHHQEYQERIQGANQVLDGHPHELQPVVLRLQHILLGVLHSQLELPLGDPGGPVGAHFRVCFLYVGRKRYRQPIRQLKYRLNKTFRGSGWEGERERIVGMDF